MKEVWRRYEHVANEDHSRLNVLQLKALALDSASCVRVLECADTNMRDYYSFIFRNWGANV